MANASVDFILNPQETVDVDFTVTPDVTYQAVLDLSASTRNHDELSNRDLPDQHPTSAITGLDDTLGSLTESVSTIEGTIETYGDVVTHNADEFATAEQGALADTALQAGDNVSELVNDAGYLRASSLNGYATEGYVNAEIGNITDILDSYGNIVTHNVNEFATAAQGAKADTALQSGDNISELTNDANYATENFVEDKIEDVTDTFGDIVTHNVSEFATSAQGALADTALQPNDDISELNNDVGYITSASLPTVNNGTLTIQKNGSSVGTFTANQATNTTVNVVVPTQASDIGALPDTTTIADLTTTAQLNALNSGATTTNIGQITTNENDITDINDKIPSQASSSNQLADKNFVNSSISTNTANFIGTFNSVAELEAYSGTLTNNDYAFVQTTDTAGNTLYDRYKWNGSAWLFEYELNNSSFTAEQWATINSGATSSDVALAQSALQPNDNVSELVNDAGYITSASLPTVNDATLTIQKNGTSVGTFTANASSNVTANITVPTDTSDLTNGAGYITGITSSDVTTALGYTPYNSSNPSGYISGITSGDVTTALGYTPADDSGVVKLTGNQTISGTKSFNASLTRTSTIDPSTTTGETEVRTLSTVATNGSTVIASYNASRSSTTISNRQRVNNPNVNNGWYDIRVNVNDAGQAYVNCTGSSSVTNLSHTYTTSSTGTTYLGTMGWVNNPSTSTNVVHRSGTETISGNKTFSGSNTFSGNNSFTGDNTFTKQIYGTLASYSAVNGSSNANPYKKVAECVLTGAYQSVVIPFIYTMTTTVTTSNAYTGKITFRTDSTAGTAGTRGVSLGVSPNFINNGDFEFYVCHQNNYPESNQVTFQLWVYVKNTYQGVNIMPLRQGAGGVNYSTSNVTWGNALDEQASLPAGYTVTNQIFTDNYSKTPTDDNTTSTQIDTVGARNTKINSVMNSILPTGTVLPYGGSSAPTGFLLCDGSAVSRTTYADLYVVIGDTYGSGDGSTTFNLPNLSTAVLPSSSTVSVVGNGNALGLTDDLSSAPKAQMVVDKVSGLSGQNTYSAQWSPTQPLAVGTVASSYGKAGTEGKGLGVSQDPDYSGLTGSITGVTLNYIIKA